MNVLIMNDLHKDDACFWIRLGFYMKSLVQIGAIHEFWLNDIQKYDCADVVIIQRHVNFTPFLISKMFESPRPIILESDDSLLDLASHHPQHAYYSARAYVSWHFLKHFISAISVSTETLGQNFRRYNGRTRVIANTLPFTFSRRATRSSKDGRPLRIGYAGTSTHKEDFRFLTNTLSTIKEMYGSEIEYHFFGWIPPELQQFESGVFYTPFDTSYLSYINTLRTANLDLCLAPLADTKFNRYKSAIKYLEYTHFGAVGLYSDIVPYHGIRGGFVLKNDARQWHAALIQLIEDGDLRARLFGAAVEQIQTEFCFAREREKWKDTLNLVAGMRARVNPGRVLSALEEDVLHSKACRDERFLEYLDRFWEAIGRWRCRPLGVKRRLLRTPARGLVSAAQKAALLARGGMRDRAYAFLLAQLKKVLKKNAGWCIQNRASVAKLLQVCRSVLKSQDAEDNKISDVGVPAEATVGGRHSLAEQLQCRCVPVVETCKAAGVRRVAFYGAGSHTATLLPLWREQGAPPVHCIVVTKKGDEMQVCGVPVVAADQFDPWSVDAIVLSSQRYELEMWETCRERWPMLPVFALWNGWDPNVLDGALRAQTADYKGMLERALQLNARVARIAAICRKKRYKRIGLYGAGSHSRDVLAVWRAVHGPDFACILVTEKTGQRRWAGLPVRAISDRAASDLDAVVLSSHVYERAMYHEACSLHPRLHIFSIWNTRDVLKTYRNHRQHRLPDFVRRHQNEKDARIVVIGDQAEVEDFCTLWTSAGGRIPFKINIELFERNRALQRTLGDILQAGSEVPDAFVLCSISRERELFLICQTDYPDVPCYGTYTSQEEWDLCRHVKRAAERATAQGMKQVALYWSGEVSRQILELWKLWRGPRITALLAEETLSRVTAVGQQILGLAHFNFSTVDGVVLDAASYARDQFHAQVADFHPARTIVVGDPQLADNEERQWVYRNRLTPKMATLFKQQAAQFGYRPFFTFIMPVYNTPPELLIQALNSILKQTYPKWEACITDDGSSDVDVKRILSAYAKADTRFRIRRRHRNQGIARASNAALEEARGEFVIPVDSDDIFEADALYQIVSFLQTRRDAELIYTDSNRISQDGKLLHSLFKPDWAPELVLSYCYLNHLKIFRRSLLRRVGSFDPSLECSQDYDLFLRSAEKARTIEHIPLVLYHHRINPGQRSGSSASQKTGLKAVAAHLGRLGFHTWLSVGQPAFAKQTGDGIFQLHPRRNFGERVSVVIRSHGDSKALGAFLNRIMAGTGHDNCEFLIVGSDPGSGRGAQALLAAKYRADVLRWVTVSDQLGGACHMNAAVEAATGTYVLFLDDSLEVQSERWLEYLLLYAKMPGVSVVGPRILSPEGNISEAGLVFTGSSTTGYAFRGLKPDSRGYNHFAAVARNCSAVSRRGMLVKRDRFLELGGFDHGNSEEASFDLDFCRRVLEAGDRIVYTPFVVFRSLKPDMDETSGSRANVNGHSGHLSDQRDRFYNINQSLDPERLFCADPHRNNRLLLSDLSSKKLKILSVSHNLDHEGAPLSKLAIDRHLSAQQGVELEVFSPVAGDLVTRYEELHIPIEVKEVDGWNRDYARYVELVEALKYKIAKGRYDLVYANTLQTFWAIQAAQAMNVPSVWNIRESVDYRSYLEHFAKEPRIFEEALAAFAKANRTVFVCQATARLFTPYDKLGTSAVIHNGISLDAVRRWLRVDRRKLRQQLRLPLDKLIVSIIGTVDRRKGQADFVRCANEILQKRQDVEFLIVGAKEDPLVKNSLSEVRRLIGPTQSHIHLVPLVPDALKFYRASDIFVCASYEESFPRVILEAMAFGLPIVSTPVYGIREQIDDEVTGLFFSPGDVGAMTRLVEQLLDNADLRAVLGARARRKVEKAFREERMVDEYCKLFKVVSLECTNVVPGPA